MKIPRIKKILIIDDDIGLRKYISTVLMWNEFEIKDCTDTEAESVACDYIPDVILLDVHMKEYTGLEIIQLLKKHKLTKNIPVIFMTGEQDTQVIDNCFSLGAIGYIPKPVNVHRLVETITVMWTFHHINQRPTIMSCIKKLFKF